MKKYDPKELGIPNINFSCELEEDDERQELFKKQRIERGFDDSELWSLGDTIARFTVPRLKVFIEQEEEHTPENSANPIYDFARSNLVKMKQVLRALELLARDEGVRLYSDEEKEEVDKGLELLGYVLPRLWN